MTEASDVPFGLEVTKGFVAKFLLAGIGFVGTIFLARILGPAAFGGYYLVWTLVQIVKLPIDGFSKAGKKRFSETDTSRPRIVGTVTLVVVSIAAVAVVAAFATRAYIRDFTGLADGHLLLILLLVPVGLFTPFQGLIAATGRVSQSIWIDFLRSVLTTPLQLLFALLDYGAAGMAYGLSLATFATLPVTQYTLGTWPKLPDRETLQQLWTYARHSTVSTALSQAYSRLDLVLLGMLMTPAAAGNYSVALKLTLPAVLLSEVASDGLIARVSNLHSKGERVAPDLSNTLSFSSILAIPIFVGSTVLAESLVVTIYGTEYAGAGPLLVGLALYRLVRTQASPLMQTINGIDRPDLNVRISGATLAINVVLGVVLTLQFGSIGVVAATVVAESIRYVLLLSVVRRHLETTALIPRTLGEQFAAAVLMGAIVVGLNELVAVRSWLHLFVIVGSGAAVYAVALTALSERLRYTVWSVLADANLTERIP